MVAKPHLLLPSSNNAMISETWKPFEINELDEMERVQSLKHRENLIKGMGITDFVNRILHGTPGTFATIPPSFVNSHNTKTVSIPNNININGNNLIGTNNTNNNNNSGSNNNNNSNNQTDDQQSNDAIGKGLPINSNFNKLEIKTKNYNPFENHSLFAEVDIKYI